MEGLSFVCIVERDEHGSDMVTWCYPSIEHESLPAVLVARSSLDGAAAEHDPAETHWSRFADHWLHSASRAVPQSLREPSGAEKGAESSESDAKNGLARCTAACVFVATAVSGAFDPERGCAMASALLASYLCSRGDPVSSVLAPWLSAEATSGFSVAYPGAPSEARAIVAALRGEDDDSDGGDGDAEATTVSFAASDFDPRRAMLRSAPSVLSSAPLQADAAQLLWCAVLTRRRVAVICSDRSRLESFVRAAPLLAWHRGDFSVCRPFVSPDPEATAAEAEDLSSAGVYVAGFESAKSLAAIEARMAAGASEDADNAGSGTQIVHEVRIDLDSGEVVVPPRVQQGFKCGRVGREVAEACSQGVPAQKAVRAIAEKTRALIDHLEGGAVKRGGGGNMARFFEMVALAEGIELEDDQ